MAGGGERRAQLTVEVVGCAAVMFRGKSRPKKTPPASVHRTCTGERSADGVLLLESVAFQSMTKRSRMCWR